MRYKNWISIKTLIIYNSCFYLPQNLMLSTDRKVVKLSKYRRFYLTYLVFFIKQIVKLPENEKPCLTYLVSL